MKNKILIVTTVIALIVAAIIIAISVNGNKEENESKVDYNKSSFVIDNENKYIFTTSDILLTMQWDGGSHINIYYEIDFNENIIVKCQDKYIGFKGYEYEGKIVATKQINDVEKNELKSILDEAINNPLEKPDGVHFEFCTIASFNNETVKIYDKDTIEKIVSIVESN